MLLFSGSFLDMLHAASLTKQLLQGGSEELYAVATSLNQVYARNQTSVQSKQVLIFMRNKC